MPRPSHEFVLLLFLSGLAPGVQSQSNCPVTPLVPDYPTGGPRVEHAWYANKDRTIWATFWGWDFVGHGPKEAYPREGYIATRKVLWYKPSDSPLTVTGRRLDSAAPPVLYDISRDSRPTGPMQPSRVDFPTAGCWELDAKAGSSKLRIVVQVKEEPK